jgi:PAS domain S-box-containing protein
MVVTTIPNRDAVALILAPAGRDAQIAAALLAEAAISSAPAPDFASFVDALSEDTAFAVITEEELRSVDLRGVSQWIARQPSWSDLPFVILTRRGGGPERNPAAVRVSEILGNVSFIERPFHATTFISVARSAMRGRRRQFDARLRMEALDEGERRLQTALEAGRLGAWELDLTTNTLTASATCKRIFGRGSDASFSYKDLVASIHPDDKDRMRASVLYSIDTGVDYSIECRTMWPDGTSHWAEIRAQLYRDRVGRALKMVGVSADITTRMRHEENLRQLNETLEERVKERTAELQHAHATVMEEVSQRERAEEQLRQAQKMEAIGQLTGGIAHDFNNLLMAVLGNLELLRKHFDDDPKAVRLVDGALQGAQRGASLTQRLLAFSRRQDLHVGPVDLVRLVAGIEELLRRSVGSSIIVETHLHEHLPFVVADSNQIELALLNLAVNARDAMPDGGRIIIELQEMEQVHDEGEFSRGRYVVLSVSDTGHGMDEQTLQKAVEPFFTTKELGKGTGLGLSMIHGLALQLKGRLQLKSEWGSGTTAELWMPVAIDAATPQPPADIHVDIGAEQHSGSKRILLVDDDALIAMSTADMLTDLGHDVVETHSGKEALEVFAVGSFDLIITDYSMPGMNGGELSRAVRELVPRMPILVASGYADLPTGFDLKVARLAKPYTQEQLAFEIKRVTGNR